MRLGPRKRDGFNLLHTALSCFFRLLAQRQVSSPLLSQFDVVRRGIVGVGGSLATADRGVLLGDSLGRVALGGVAVEDVDAHVGGQSIDLTMGERRATNAETKGAGQACNCMLGRFDQDGVFLTGIGEETQPRPAAREVMWRPRRPTRRVCQPAPLIFLFFFPSNYQ